MCVQTETQDPVTDEWRPAIITYGEPSIIFTSSPIS